MIPGRSHSIASLNSLAFLNNSTYAPIGEQNPLFTSGIGLCSPTREPNTIGLSTLDINNLCNSGFGNSDTHPLGNMTGSIRFLTVFDDKLGGFFDQKTKIGVPASSFSNVKPISDFNSDTEEIGWIEFNPRPPTVKFFNNRQLNERDFIGGALNLFDFVSFKEQIPKIKKIYECKECGKILDSAASKGGHMAKQHPDKSQKYKTRINIAKIRKAERNRNKFLGLIGIN